MYMFVSIRFEKKRVEEELEVLKRKASRLKSHIEGSSVIEKLKEELKEYRGIVKCSICLDRPKEVNVVHTSNNYIHQICMSVHICFGSTYCV